MGFVWGSHRTEGVSKSQVCTEVGKCEELGRNGRMKGFSFTKLIFQQIACYQGGRAVKTPNLCAYLTAVTARANYPCNHVHILKSDPVSSPYSLVSHFPILTHFFFCSIMHVGVCSFFTLSCTQHNCNSSPYPQSCY